jgi:hypothetical protein
MWQAMMGCLGVVPTPPPCWLPCGATPLPSQPLPPPDTRRAPPGARLRPGRQADNEYVPLPLQTDGHCPPEATERAWLAASAFHPGTWGGSQQAIGSVDDTWAAPLRTVMVLRPGMKRVMILAALSATCWPHLSHVHNTLWPLWMRLLSVTNNTMDA